MFLRTTLAALLSVSLAFADDATPVLASVPAAPATPASTDATGASPSTPSTPSTTENALPPAAPAAPIVPAAAAPKAAVVVAKSAEKSSEVARPSAATNPPIKPGVSRCFEEKQPGLVVEANTSNGQEFALVRRVLRITADRRTLVCREFDRNADGRYDTARHYDAKGEPTYEEIDSDHDGRVDLWLFFQGGKVGEEQRDTNLDGEADETITFNEVGQISRVRRDRNFDGKVDEWEIYANGNLERRGVDDSFEGRVTRWDRDGELVPPEAPVAEEKKEEAPPPEAKPSKRRGAGAPKAPKATKKK
jgi:hypothetical protein